LRGEGSETRNQNVVEKEFEDEHKEFMKE